MKKTISKLGSILLSVAIMLSLMPAMAFAETKLTVDDFFWWNDVSPVYYTETVTVPVMIEGPEDATDINIRNLTPTNIPEDSYTVDGNAITFDGSKLVGCEFVEYTFDIYQGDEFIASVNHGVEARDELEEYIDTELIRVRVNKTTTIDKVSQAYVYNPENRWGDFMEYDILSVEALDENISVEETEDGWVITGINEGSSKIFATYVDLHGEEKTATVNVVIQPPKDKGLKHYERIEPTCEKDGREEGWYNSDEDNWYADEDAEEWIEEPAILPALGHDLVKVEAKEATAMEEGNIEHWACARCGKLFSDAEGENEISAEDVVIAKKERMPIADASLTIENMTYTGKTLVPEVIVELDGKTLVQDQDYVVVFSDNTKVGTGKVSIMGVNNYIGEVEGTFEIAKAAGTLKVTKKTATLKYNTLKKKSLSIARTKVMTFKNRKGTVKYSKASGNKKITINKKTGKITVKKGLKKGTYKLKVKVTDSGNESYKAITKTITLTIKVK